MAKATQQGIAETNQTIVWVPDLLQAIQGILPMWTSHSNLPVLHKKFDIVGLGVVSGAASPARLWPIRRAGPA